MKPYVQSVMLEGERGYLDTDVFLSYLDATPNRIEVIEALLDQAQRGHTSFTRPWRLSLKWRSPRVRKSGRR